MEENIYEKNCAKCGAKIILKFQIEREVFCSKCLYGVKERYPFYYMQFLKGTRKFIELEGSEINGVLYDIVPAYDMGNKCIAIKTDEEDMGHRLVEFVLIKGDV